MKLTPSAHLDTFCRDNLPPLEQWPQLRFDLPELHYPDRLNAATALLDGTVTRLCADRPCLLSPTEAWTYGEVLERANQIAQVLADDHGLVPGQRVLLRGPNSPWLATTWLGVLKAGGVAVTTMPLLRRQELSTLVELTKPAVLVCDHRFVDEMQAAAGALPVVTYGLFADGSLEARCEARSGVFRDVETAADDVAILAATSGTTGRPKVTMHFHRDLLAVADTFSHYVVKPEPADLFSGTPPLAFTYGLGSLLLFPLRAGAATLMLERTTPTELADAVTQRGVTVLSTAPTAYRAILRSGQADKMAHLRRPMSAGEALPEAVWREFYEATGVRIIDGLGSTEMLHVFISAEGEAIRPGSTGRAVPGSQARVVDNGGRPVADGTPGRLAVIGPTGCRYLADARQRVYVQDGWNITGDTYVRDADGYFWYQARSDDMIVSSGYNIGAPEVEWAIEQHPDVVECAVVGRPDDERGAIVHAVVVLRAGVLGDRGKVAELQDFAKQVVAPYKYPRSIEFVAALPRTESGKLQRFRLRADQPPPGES